MLKSGSPISVRMDASLLILLFVMYSIHVIWGEEMGRKSIKSKHAEGHINGARKGHSLAKSSVIACLSLGAMLFLAYWIVESGIKIVNYFGLSGALIGLTVVAVGTSIPELITALVSAKEKESGVSLGSALSSNSFNILVGLGICGLAGTSLAISPKVAYYDCSSFFVITALTVVFLLTKRRLSRAEGLVLLRVLPRICHIEDFHLERAKFELSLTGLRTPGE